MLSYDLQDIEFLLCDDMLFFLVGKEKLVGFALFCIQPDKRVFPVVDSTSSKFFRPGWDEWLCRKVRVDVSPCITICNCIDNKQSRFSVGTTIEYHWLCRRGHFVDTRD